MYGSFDNNVKQTLKRLINKTKVNALATITKDLNTYLKKIQSYIKRHLTSLKFNNKNIFHELLILMIRIKPFVLNFISLSPEKVLKQIISSN